MVVNNKKITCLSILAGSLLSASIAQAVPSEITFSNSTPLALMTSIAGHPGQGIAPSITKSVSYVLVAIGCSYAPDYRNCPIEFTNKENGEKVATVYFNSETATLSQPPVFYGNYANEYEVLGWNASPITLITIARKS